MEKIPNQKYFDLMTSLNQKPNTKATIKDTFFNVELYEHLIFSQNMIKQDQPKVLLNASPLTNKRLSPILKTLKIDKIDVLNINKSKTKNNYSGVKE